MATARRDTMKRRFAAILFGVGAAFMATPLWIPTVLEHAGTWMLSRQSLASPPNQLVKAQRRQNPNRVVPWRLVPQTRVAKPGTVVGQLSIPTLGLTVPILEGTTNSILLLAAGHLRNSVMPGQNGTSVVAAHNATYFRHLNRLKPRSPIIVTTKQGTFWFQVTHSVILPENSAVINTTAPTLDLEACWPLDALYFTPSRFVVQAVLVKDRVQGRSLNPLPTSVSPPAQIASWISSRFPLALKDNALPMGHLSYRSPLTATDFQYQQSPHPLAVERDGIHLWIAFKDLSQAGLVTGRNSLFAHNDTRMLSADPYWDARSVAFTGDLNVQLTLNRGGQAVGMTLRDNVQIDNRPYSETATAKPGTKGWALTSVTFQAQ